MGAVGVGLGLLDGEQRADRADCRLGTCVKCAEQSRNMAGCQGYQLLTPGVEEWIRLDGKRAGLRLGKGGAPAMGQIA